MRTLPRVTAGCAIVGAFLASVAFASNEGTYIEVMGQSLLVNAPQLDVAGEAPAKSAPPSFGNSPVSPASNVDRNNNIPSYADTTNTTAAPQGNPAPVQPTAQHIEQYANIPLVPTPLPPPIGVGGNSVSGGQLPNPKIDYQTEVLNQVAPMDTETIRAIMNEIYLRQGAAATPIRPAVSCQSSQYTLDLSPGATPPVVRVTKGVGAIVNFVDAAGNPWPITFARNFHEQASAATQMAPHVMSVTANSPHLQGSIGVVLEGLTTPITFIVTPGQEQTDCRVDLRVPGLAPGATPEAGRINTRPGMTSGGLMDYIYGATPDGAKRLAIKMHGNVDNTTRAWQTASGKLVLRTPASVVSPGWYQSVSALDGTTVYEMPPTSVINVSVDGQPIKVLVNGLTPIAKANTSLLN